jgi:hypothetical protein
MADLATLQLRLAEAELAYHRLQTGTAEIEVEQGGEVAMKVKYSLTSVDKLRAYISDLKAQVAALTGTTSELARRRPLYVELG